MRRSEDTPWRDQAGVVPPDALPQLPRTLLPGERVVWTGGPDPAVLFTPADVFLIPFSIFWCGFAIFWEAGAAAGGGGPFFVIWGIPFICVGLYMVFGRFIYKARQKRRTVYTLTNERAIIAVGASSMSDMPLGQVPIDVKRSRDGHHASVTFGPPAIITRGMYGNTGMDFFGRGQTQFAFYDVAGPDLLLSALDQVRRR